MESDAILQMYESSVEKYQIRLSPFTSDGVMCVALQTKDAIQTVQKEQCANHVNKRMGSNLGSLVCEYKGKKLYDSKELSRKGRVTILRIDAFQNFYICATGNNKNNHVKME